MFLVSWFVFERTGKSITETTASLLEHFNWITLNDFPIIIRNFMRCLNYSAYVSKMRIISLNSKKVGFSELECRLIICKIWPQITSVKFSQDGFQGTVTNYASDVAVVEISPTLQFNTEKNQVCMETTDPLTNEKKTGRVRTFSL